MNLSKYTTDQLERISNSFAVSEIEFPSLFMRPNVAQYRAFTEIYTKKDGRYPDMVSVEFANGVGKTSMFALDVIGWTMGPEYLRGEYYPEEAIEFWKSLAPLRDIGKMTLRLVCSNVDIKEGGSVCDILKKVFPWCKLTHQDNTGTYKQIDIPHPTIRGITNHISVLTFDQAVDKHAGSTTDRIWVNENLPESLWAETNARTRGGGNIVQFATILGLSSHLNELEDSENFNLVRCQGHLYENCKGEEITSSMAAEVLNEIGIQLEPNTEGPGYITHGVLSKPKIDAMIDAWQRTNPDEVQARKTGKPISEGGKIFPIYNDSVHKIPSFTKYPECPMVMLCDPHPQRPDAVIWAKILSNDRLAIVDEWPTFSEFGYFDKIKDSRFTVNQKCDIWREFEASRGYTNLVGDNRVGDPNAFQNPDEQSTGMIKDLYAKNGFKFYVSINDDFEYGREMVNQYFWYDANIRKLLPSDPAGWPRLVIFDRCVNVRRSVANFAIKIKRDKSLPITLRVDERFKCFSDLVRYLVIWHQTHHFNDIKPDPNRITDFQRTQIGRIPKSMRSGIPGKETINTHGRVLLTCSRN